MNDFLVMTTLFTISFLATLLYQVKGKKDTFFSYILNLDLEYIIVGLFIYLLFSQKANHYDFTTYITFLNILTVTLFSTQYKFSLLKSIGFRIHLFILLLYSINFILFSSIFYLFDNKNFLLLAVIFNTTFSYCLILLSKLLKIKREKTYYSILITSVYPFYSFIVYSIYILIKSHFSNLMLILAITLIILLVIIKTLDFNDKRVLYTLNILILIIFTGISLSFNFSSIFIGFITGIFMANLKYGDIFLNTLCFIEKFIYTIIFMLTGIIVGRDIGSININTFFMTILLLLTLIVIRKPIAKFLFKRIALTENRLHLTNMGIFPLIMLLDAKISLKIDILRFSPVFVFLLILLEILNYAELRHEKRQ